MTRTRSSTLMLSILHFFGNALLLWIAYYWLGVGESTTAHLVWNAVLLVLILCAALWLHGSGFAYFKSDRTRLAPALGSALRHIFPLFALAIFVILIYVGVIWLDQKINPKSPTAQAVVEGIFWVVRWLILPVLFLPLATNMATNGWRAFRGGSWHIVRNWLYWIEVVILLVCAIWVPLKLLAWVPKVGAFPLQMTSFLLRLFIAYLLFVVSWLLIEFFSSGGSPRVTQARTVSAP